MKNKQIFDELFFFAKVKKCPVVFLGKKSLISLRDFLAGMNYAFSFYNEENYFKYFHEFIDWYHHNQIKSLSGYACWWNHILYTSGNDDCLAFDEFFKEFELYLSNVYHLTLPIID